MRKWLFILMAIACLFALPAMGEEAAYENFTADTQSTCLDLGEQQVKDYDAFCSFLQKFPNLEKVDMFATPIKRAQIDLLNENFPNVEFGWTMILQEHQIRTDATAFSTLHNNQSEQHSSKDFEILKYCKNLLALDIGHNKVDDLSFLYDLPNLKVLILACNQVTDMTPVGSLTQLEYLEIFKNRIQDISPLLNCTNLIDLNICFNRVKDYEVIKSLKKLERLWLYNSNNYTDSDPVPKDIIRGIKDALPSCYIDSTHYSTLGGWREHDRYFVIFDMFKSGTYIPFETEEQAQ